MAPLPAPVSNSLLQNRSESEPVTIISDAPADSFLLHPDTLAGQIYPDRLRLIDGPIALLPCASLNFYDKCDNCDEKVCGLNRTMKETRDATLMILDRRTHY